jgi:hypothetical protein
VPWQGTASYHLFFLGGQTASYHLLYSDKHMDARKSEPRANRSSLGPKQQICSNNSRSCKAGLFNSSQGSCTKARPMPSSPAKKGRHQIQYGPAHSGNPIPRSMRGFLVAPHTSPRHTCQSGLGPLSRPRWKKREEEHRQRGRREGHAGATKPATPRLAAAEQALDLRVWGWGS